MTKVARPARPTPPSTPPACRFCDSQSAPAKLVRPMLAPMQAAIYLGVAPKTLANWRSGGGGPRFVRLSCSGAPSSRGSIRYPIAELEAWCAARMVVSTSDSGLTAPVEGTPR